MGAWGTNSFENDDAADWVYEFESGGAEAVMSALDRVNTLAPSVAIAAVEIVAAARGGWVGKRLG